MKNLTTVALLFLALTFCFANNGEEKNNSTFTPQKIEGKIIDKTTNEALAGVAIQLSGSEQKVYTDFEGNFIIDGIRPGVYDIDVLYVSYQGLTLENISTNANGLTLKVELESVSE